MKDNIKIIPYSFIIGEMLSFGLFGSFLYINNILGYIISFLLGSFFYSLIIIHYLKLNRKFIFKNEKGKVILIKNTLIFKRTLYTFIALIGYGIGWSCSGLIYKGDMLHILLFFAFIGLEFVTVYYINSLHMLYLKNFTIEKIEKK